MSSIDKMNSASKLTIVGQNEYGTVPTCTVLNIVFTNINFGNVSFDRIPELQKNVVGHHTFWSPKTAVIKYPI